MTSRNTGGHGPRRGLPQGMEMPPARGTAGSSKLSRQLVQIGVTAAIILGGLVYGPMLFKGVVVAAVGTEDAGDNIRAGYDATSAGERVKAQCIPAKAPEVNEQGLRDVASIGNDIDRMMGFGGVEGSEAMVECMMSIETERLCDPDERAALASALSTYAHAAQKKWAYTQRIMKQAGHAAGMFQLIQSVTEEKNSGIVTATDEGPISSAVASKVETLSQLGHLSAADFGWFESSVPEAIRPHLKAPTDNSCGS